MNAKQESGMAIIICIIMALAMIIIMSSCRSRQSVSEERQRTTLLQSCEGYALSLLSDKVCKHLIAAADSIVFTFGHDHAVSSMASPGPHLEQETGAAAPSHVLGRAAPTSYSHDPQAMLHNGRQGAVASLTPDNRTSSPSSLKAVKIYAPHLDESIEKGSIEATSSAHRNDKSMQCANEEVHVKKSEPPDCLVYGIMIVMILLALGMIYHRICHKSGL